MAFENVCFDCEKLRFTMIEKNNEIKNLKLHIQNLTNYLLWKDSFLKVQPIYDSNFIVEGVKNAVIEPRFYSSDLFIKSCDILDKHLILNSKSVQTEEHNEDSLSDERVIGSTKEHQIKNIQDYIYDKNYQMYYSLTTGYYYDEKSGLMYEPQSGTYYKYDYDKKEYERVRVEEGASSGIHEDEKTCNYICQSVVDQVSNLNLNEESTQNEKLENKVTNIDILMHEKFHEKSCNSTDNELLDATSSEVENISLGCAKDWQPEEGSKLTVSDMVKQVVEEQNNMTDYVYDESYKMYYSPSTGYFYDAVRNLLYDPTSGIYYLYDSDNQKYEFYYQILPNIVENNKALTTEDNVDSSRLMSRKKYWKKKLEHSGQSPTSPKLDKDNNNPIDMDEEFSAPEDGEIFSSDDDSDLRISIVKAPDRSPYPKEKCIEESFPPSIRAIVENSENLQIGSLILITCSGGIIGRDEANAIYLPDVCVSKTHANISFNSEIQTYSIEDLGSQNGTFINDKRLSEPKLKSDPHTLNHGDKLSLGSFKLLIHIHEGHDTCDNCEPGQVLAEIASHAEKTAVVISKEEKEKNRREELRKLKKKYGLQGDNFVHKKSSVMSQNYEDKAEIRRKTVGSDNPYEKTEETSIDVSMPETNKGYQMLKKMGWKEGQTLGISDSGLAEPIPLRPWTGTAGLGSPVQPSSRPPAADKRAVKWVKARERYFQLSLGRDAS